MDERNGHVGDAQDGAPRRRRFRLGATLTAGAAAAVVGVVILVGLTSAGAQTSSTVAPATPAPGARPPGPPHGFGPGGWDHHEGGPDGMPGGMAGGVLHGEFTAVDPNGGYRTIDVQSGTVTAVSASSITVKSQDGFTRTYVVSTKTLVDAGRDGIADVKVGHTVHVEATVTGNTATAADIFDQTNLQRLRGQWMPPGPAGAPWSSPQPTTGA